MTLPEEDKLVARLAALCPQSSEQVHVGIGDDCAVVEAGGGIRMLLKTDSVVEGVHFSADCPAELAGRKALCRVLSDVAAMAGEPGPFLVTAGLGGVVDARWLESAYKGISKAAGEFGGSLAGGEITRSPGAGFLSVSMAGWIPSGRAPILRSGGKAGDILFVTGELGNSIAGWHLTFHPRIEEARWLAENFRPSAMLDLSDGLASDLPRLAAASCAGFHLTLAKLPLRAGATQDGALCDGEDYELLFAMPEEASGQLDDAWKKRFPNLRLTRIGRLARQGEHDDLGGGYDHLARGEKKETQP